MTITRALSLLTLTALLAACSEEPDLRFEASKTFPGNTASIGLTLEPCLTTVNEEPTPAECGVLLVPENRSDPDSRLIPLPVLRVPSTSANPQSPVFRLGGGPGVTNIYDAATPEMLKTHDYVRIGYRGADGVTRMDCPGVDEAMTAPRHIFEPAAKKALEDALYACLKGYEDAGFDLDGYTILEVIADMELARREMGYTQVNLHSGSYGTRLALLWAHLHPDSVHRSVIVAPNPPGRMGWTPQIVDLKIRQYSDLCALDEYCSSRTDDLSETVRTTLQNLPDSWYGVPIDEARVRVGLFNMLYQTDMAAMGFDALFSAEEGDYSGVAAFSMVFNFLFSDALIWGDSALKSLTADNRPAYVIEDFNPPGTIMGTPMSELGEAFRKVVERLDVKMVPEEFQGPQTSDVATIVMSGNLDIATPREYAVTEIMPYLPNGTLVPMQHAGHQDLVPGERELYYHFLATGEVDMSLISDRPISFKPMIGVALAVKLALGAAVLLGLLILYVLMRITRRLRG